ncbi:SOS response-associated peptidase [Asticcacaulis endophyticus]|uniref:Abasic site processing protein n=1 Tax=Asticcacaulis endophyticus TaxID=1395890 RepID=A0A918Q3P0_9CAUL|nr:SOS response-associated peptidase [Asticcacaulis endophyticus]GGZ32499.1 DUF159 family protein [Asticcacaulis endophyticus]
MCGRFKPKKTWSELHDILNLLGMEVPQGDLFAEARLEIRPTNQYPIIRAGKDGTYETAMCRWSLVPYWFKKPLSEFKLTTFNAKIEEAAEKATFKSAFARRHCLISVDSFWEWWGAHPSGAKGKKQRWEISRADNHQMVFAGIWDRAETADGPIESFTLMTRAAGDDLDAYHTREPVTLVPDEYTAWLNCQPVTSIHPAEDQWPSAVKGTFRFAPADDIPDPPKRLKNKSEDQQPPML